MFLTANLRCAKEQRKDYTYAQEYGKKLQQNLGTSRQHGRKTERKTVRKNTRSKLTMNSTK